MKNGLHFIIKVLLYSSFSRKNIKLGNHSGKQFSSFYGTTPSSQGNEIMYLQKVLHKNVIIASYIKQKLDTTQISVKWSMNRQIMIYLHNAIPFNNFKNELWILTNLWMNLKNLNWKKTNRKEYILYESFQKNFKTELNQ